MKPLNKAYRLTTLFLPVILSMTLMSCDSCDDDKKKKSTPEILDPQLGYSDPDRGAHEVSTTSIVNISFHFNKPMEAATINQDTFTVRKEGGDYLSGTVSYNTDDRIAVFTPALLLTSGTYTAALDRGIKYIDGTNLESRYTWSFTTNPRRWTIMVYLDGDNNLESFMMEDIDEMMRGYVEMQGMDLILLVDRIEGYSNDDIVLGQDFTDTRLYRISRNFYTRLDGVPFFQDISRSSVYEANMGDPATLKKFITFCKNNYPADKYGLILWNHGDGVSKGGDSTSGTNTLFNKTICMDDTDDGDVLYTAEISDGLTYSESVDLLGFDACLMGSIEIAYQYRPGNGSFEARYMAASPPEEWGAGWDYDGILSRIKSGGGDNGENDTIVALDAAKELYHDPESMTPAELCGIIVEEQFDSAGQSMSDQALSCYDLSVAASVKSAVDALAVSLDAETTSAVFGANIRGSESSPVSMHYFNAGSELEWMYLPFFDLFDLCEKINGYYSDPLKTKASSVIAAIENMMLYSFAGTQISGAKFIFNGKEFTNGKNGMHIFCPHGDREYDHPVDGLQPHWNYQWWYNAKYTNDEWPGHLYGKLSWCADGASENSSVENWFELLDKWYDENPDNNWYTP